MTTNSVEYNRDYVNKCQKRVIEQLGGRCLICASRDSLEVHHIFGYKNRGQRGRGKHNRVFEWKRNMKGLALLCTDHHNEYHQFCKDVLNHDTLLDYILFKFIENTVWCYK